MLPTNSLSLSLTRSNRNLANALIAWPAPRSKPLRPTAWLDGLRGLAALEVFIFHYVDIWFHGDAGYGASEEYTQFYRLPFIRSFWHSGRCMVCMFFIISGYVLTQKSLLMLRRGQYEAVFNTVSSAIFRRGFRLIPPTLVSCIIGFIMVRLGYRGGKDNEYLPYYDSISKQAWHFLIETLRYLNFFGWNPRSYGGDLMHKYEAVVWSVPMEFVGSLAIFVVLIGTARLKPSVRNIFIATIACYALLQGCWSIFCFFSGILLADYQLAEDAADKELNIQKGASSQFRTIMWSAALFQGFWMAGAPMRGPLDRGDKALGFSTIWSLVPEQFGSLDVNYSLWSIAGLLIVASITRLPYAKRTLETTFCQYLGKISFALYLNHVWTRELPGAGVRTFLQALFGNSSAGFAISLFIWLGLLTVFNFMVAGLFEWTVDAPIVRFARAFEEKCLALGREGSESDAMATELRSSGAGRDISREDIGNDKPQAGEAIHHTYLDHTASDAIN